MRRLYLQACTMAAAELERLTNPTTEKVHWTRLKQWRASPIQKMLGSPSRRVGTEPALDQHVPLQYSSTESSSTCLGERDEVCGMRLLDEGIFVQDPATFAAVDLSAELRLDPRHASPWRCHGRRWGVLFRDGSLWHEVMRAAHFAGPPPGHRTISWGQQKNAGRKLWQLVAAGCHSSCLAKPGEQKTVFDVICCGSLTSVSCCQLLLLDCLVRLPALLPPLLTVSSGSSEIV